MNRKIGLNSSKSQQNIIQHLQNSLKEIKKQAHNDKKLLNNLTLQKFKMVQNILFIFNLKIKHINQYGRGVTKG